MPRALRVCTTTGCIELVKAGKCDRCKRAGNKQRWEDSSQRDYDASWRALSKAFLNHFPACFNCGKQATQVDHIDGTGPSGARGHDWSNLQSLCQPCHSAKTAACDGAFGRW